LSPDEKSTLIDLLDKVRTAEYQHLAPDEHFRISASYDTSDPSRLIDRLGKYAPLPPPKARRDSAERPTKRVRPSPHRYKHTPPRATSPLGSYSNKEVTT